MHAVFRFRSALAPVLFVLLAVALPAEAYEGVAVLYDLSRTICHGSLDRRLDHRESSTRLEESHLVARKSTSYYPKAALKVPDVGYMRQLSAQGVLSVSPSNIRALHGKAPRKRSMC
ncbi:hypothetical protein NKH71_03735 [Mesorhizobium sp. M0983]|uniref:hypothetical protein n=1 Tax=Mesorhizobium sp. M0983 TaxID=2957040 RepID=UPI00333D1EEB